MAKFGHVGGRFLLTYYDLYQRLQLQFYVLLIMGAMDTRNMYSNFAVNKYLHTAASCWILLILKIKAKQLFVFLAQNYARKNIVNRYVLHHVTPSTYT